MDIITNTISAQKAFFRTRVTKDINFRKAQLRLLYNAVRSYEDEIYSALYKDFGKSEFESYSTETGLVLSEIRYQISHLNRWSRPKKLSGTLLDFPSSSKIYHEPYGQVLIIAPWNYPFQLAMTPLAGAISAGNTAIIKPSELSPSVSAVIAKIIKETFSEEYIACVEGGISESQDLLSQKNDFIFFTGSSDVAKIVMNAAAKNLTPFTLELGGKNPCIIDDSVPLNLVAKRITWGKFINAGQTCVAPDFLIANKKIAGELKEQIKNAIIEFYGSDPEISSDFQRIINLAHFKRINAMIDTDKVFFGGQTNEAERYIAPTIMHNISYEDKVMQEEIFGPILPVIEYNELDEAISILNKYPDPLSLYLFSKNKLTKKRIVNEVRAGNMNINDTVMQFINKKLPFGGIGNSGIGKYHGKFTYECFSHLKSVNQKSLLIDVPFRYPPYNSLKLNIIKKFLH
jgi:aldehyde dehydrogenase (NAD+)